MKIKIMGALVALSLSAPGLLVAQEEGGADTPSKFYNFNDMLIDGEFQKPDIMKQKGREKAKFERLSKLKKNFLPKVLETSAEQALNQ